MPQTILIVDDEQDILQMLKYNLEKEGYAVLTAQNGNRALEQARKRPNLIVLGVMMPEMDGWDVCKSLKKNTATASIPVIFLTAKGTEIDEVLGLELGAQDYIVKPISPRKLMARIKVALRNTGKARLDHESELLRFNELEINVPNYTVKVGKQELFFPKKEFEILVHLARHPRRVISREQLLNAIWGENVYVNDRTVDVHVRKIREKLEKYGDYIETVKGVGYRFKAQE